MNHRDFKYILRFTIQPGHYEEERLENLITFCRQARIDDVMFFADCEELNTGHITGSELKPWLELIARAKSRLEPLGITTSINPWTTLVHADRGRTLKKGQDFRLMVDPYGKTASVQACPLCPGWREYIADIYACYASVQPCMLWVEDDFRFHNHHPLVWGGCFCEAHMEEFSKKAGGHLNREEFVRAVLKPGIPHPYRRIWLDTCRDTMVELAERIGKSVHEVSPGTRVGLMSSVPAVHCAEGRNWEGILKGLASGNPMVNRPHLPAYTEDTPQNYLWNFSGISRLTGDLVPESTEVYPELDNGPFYRFSVSKSFTRLKLETTLCLDADGITISLFDMMGSGVKLSEGYQDILSGSKDFIPGIRKLGLKKKEMSGVKVLVSPGSSYTLHTDKGTGMQELYPRETFWASLLSCYGVPNVYSLDKKHKNEIVAVSGQYFRNLEKSEIEELFHNNIILMEGEAAFTLWEMGLGDLAGIRNAVWHLQESGFQSYEEACGGKEYCGMKGARLTAQMSAGDFVEIDYKGRHAPITEAKNPYGKTVACGMAAVGERCLILPYGRFNGRAQGHLTPLRQQMIQDFIKANDRAGDIPFVQDTPYVYACIFNRKDQTALMLVNFSNDSLEEVRIHLPALKAEEILEFGRQHPEGVKADILRQGDEILLRSGLERFDLKVLLYRNA